MENAIARLCQLTADTVPVRIASKAQENLPNELTNQPSGGIIETGKGKETDNKMFILSSKFINPNDDLYRYADKIKPEKGFDDIVCHGDPYHLLIHGMDREEWEYPAEKAAEMIQNSSEFKGEPIRLIACQTGAKADGLAQQLADILQVNVKAPTESVYVNLGDCKSQSVSFPAGGGERYKNKTFIS